MEEKLPRMITDFRELAPYIEKKSEHWQAWWDGFDGWDGYVAYTTLDSAMRCSVEHYMREEYSWDHDDPDEDAPDTKFQWQLEHGRWYLLDGERGTGVQLYRVTVYGPGAS
jgi:hypothetical protein